MIFFDCNYFIKSKISWVPIYKTIRMLVTLDGHYYFKSVYILKKVQVHLI